MRVLKLTDSPGPEIIMQSSLRLLAGWVLFALLVLFLMIAFHSL